MTIPLVECIPNFSEGRDSRLIKEILDSISFVDGISILNHSSDVDHNRTVVTFAGAPQAVEEAAFQAIKRSAALIDLNNHQGSHPRIGATDVVPFVPLSGVEMAECISIARRLGERVGNELQIPVYLYEQAAIKANRVNLEDIRRGQYEVLKAEITTNPDRYPDYGPPQLGPAGATVIGARNPLVAFNVYLTTGDPSIAKEIAKAIRHSSGGFRFVKALGMLVDGRAQISMNFTNYRSTPLHRVVEVIRREAVQHGTSIHHSELIGLIPGEALIDSAAWYLQLTDFKSTQILENLLFDSGVNSSSNSPFLDSLASATPTPGGGSAAAFAGAMGAALVAMVARLTIGKKKYLDYELQMSEIIKQADDLRLELNSIVEKDALAFQAILSAYKLPKDDQTQQDDRNAAIQKATLEAAEVPLLTAETSLRVLTLACKCISIGNINAITDAASASALSIAAITCAGYNVRINAKNLSAESSRDSLLSKLEEVERTARSIENEIQTILVDRGGIKL